MNYGLYLSASGMLTGLHRLDVAANNLANIDTVAFKPDFAASIHRPAARVEDNLHHIDSNTLLERLGGGALSAPTRTNFTPSPPELTGSPLDIAILGPGFLVLDAQGDGSGEEVRFTRDGRLTVDPAGRLASAATGDLVLDSFDQPVYVNPEHSVSISTAGVVEQEGRAIARLQIADVHDPATLVKAGDNTFRAPPEVMRERFETGALVQSGAVERSGVDPIKAMMAVTNAGGDVRNNTRILSMHDEMMDRAINTFGRVG